MVPSTSATSVTLNFSVPGASGNVVDANGIATPFTTYLPGTDPLSTAPATPNPDLLLSGGAFTLTTAGANTDFAGANDITAVNTPGIDLGSIGFTGANDIEINAVFAPIVCEIHRPGLRVRWL